MAKKKKNSRDEFDGMLMSELDNMLGSLSPDMQAQLLKGMYDMMGDGKDMINIQNESYEYQRPDYSKDAQPLAECLVNLPNAAKPSDALAEYAHIHSVMEELSKEENEQMLRNYLMNVLADLGRKCVEVLFGNDNTYHGNGLDGHVASPNQGCGIVADVQGYIQGLRCATY